MADEAAYNELKKARSDVPVEGIILQRWSPRAFSEAPHKRRAVEAGFHSCFLGGVFL